MTSAKYDKSMDMMIATPTNHPMIRAFRSLFLPNKPIIEVSADEVYTELKRSKVRAKSTKDIQCKYSNSQYTPFEDMNPFSGFDIENEAEYSKYEEHTLLSSELVDKRMNYFYVQCINFVISPLISICS